MGVKIDINDPKFDPIQYYKDFLKWSLPGKIFSHIFISDLTNWIYLSLDEKDQSDVEQLLAVWVEIGIIYPKEKTNYGWGYRINRSRLNEIGIIYE